MKVSAVLSIGLAVFAAMAGAAKMRGSSEDHRVGMEGLPAEELQALLLASLSKKVTPGLTDMITQLKELTKGMKAKVTEHKATTQASITEALRAFGDCKFAAVGDGEMATKKDEHIACRRQQVTDESAYSKCVGAESATAQSKKSTDCTDEQTFLNNFKSQCSNQCNIGGTDPAAYAANLKSFATTLEETWGRVKKNCEESTKSLTKLREQTCPGLLKTFQATKAKCDGLQEVMDSTSCSLRQDALRNCETYAACYDGKKKAYDEGKSQRWEKFEDGYAVEWQAILRLECLAGAIELTNDDARKREIEKCGRNDYSKDADVLKLKLDYGKVPDAQTTKDKCPLPTPTVGIDAEKYKEAYLTDKSANLPESAKVCSIRPCCPAAAAR